MKKSLLLSPTACKLLRARGRFLHALFPFAFQPAVLLPQDLPRFSAAATQGDLWPWIAALAPLIGIATLIFVLSLREQVKSRNRELALVNEVGQITSELIPLDEMLGRVLAKVAEMMNGVAGAVSLKDGDSSRIAASHRIPPEEAAELLRAMGTTHPICAGETAQVVHLDDQAPLYLRHRGIAATLSVPLIHHDELLGSLCVALQRNENVPAARLETLCGLGRQVALAVIRSRLLEEAQQNLARLTALRDVDLAVSSTLELRDTLRILLEHIRNLPGVVGAAVTLANGDTPLQTLAEQAGLDALLSGPGGHAPLNHLVEQVVAAGSATSISRLADRSDTPALKPLADMQIGTYWGFPLVAGEQVIGVLSVFAKTANGFDRSLHTFLTALSGEAAVAIQNARLYTKVAEQLRELQVARDLLVQTEKLSLIGELVSGVAHELNNPLTAVLGYAQLLEEDPQAEPLKADLHQIVEAALRSRTIVQGLLSVVRKHEPRREWVDVNQPLREVLQLKSYQLHVDNIVVETYLDCGLPRTLADPHQLHQVFLNLVNNAHQAMSRTHGRGHLTVKSYVIESHILRVEIADDGPGIPLGVQPRVFEPFFTTKSEGTGLGLSIAQGIVQQHGGSISFESRPGQGSRFFVDLPIVATAEATAMAEEAEPLTIASRHILVVEDEPAVAAFIAKVLQRSGHHVTTVANGQEALAALADARPDLIISDVKMPTMRGDQFFAEVQVLYPDLAGRVIFITGDIADQRTVVFLEETQQPRLVKPFSATELRRVVARVAK